MIQRLIFLDLDGVLNSAQWFARMNADCLARRPIHNMIDPACVHRLNRLIEVSAAEIVVSSTWRIVHNLVDIRAALHHHGFTGRIIGQTPRYLQNRGTEIQTWLTANGHDAENLVILDDDTDMAHLLLCLVCTSWSVGLTDADVDRALEMFGMADRCPEAVG